MDGEKTKRSTKESVGGRYCGDWELVAVDRDDWRWKLKVPTLGPCATEKELQI